MQWQCVIVAENFDDPIAQAIDRLLSREGQDLNVWLFPDGNDTDWAYDETSRLIGKTVEVF
jgi:hypothetical protein